MVSHTLLEEDEAFFAVLPRVVAEGGTEVGLRGWPVLAERRKFLALAAWLKARFPSRRSVRVIA